jgi:pimeloyl-ACP methyl ester carboxylesterase
VAVEHDGVRLGLSSPGDPVLVAFGGISGGMAMPPFEFLKLSEGIRSNTIFVRDPRRAWYHLGVPGLGRDIDGCASTLDHLIAAQRPRRTVMVGNSAGGYAALLFSRLVSRVETVLAFSPQTFIDRGRRFAHMDRRWRRELRGVYANPMASRCYFDLRSTLRPTDGRTIQTHIFVAADDRLDRLHAGRVASIPGVEVHQLPAGGHSVIRILRDQGTLKSIVEASLQGIALPDPGSEWS